ncbi:helix-turn-helix domain-containing protein [Dysosmobacter sp.]
MPQNPSQSWHSSCAPKQAQAGLSQKEPGEFLEISDHAIGMMETGNRDTSIKKLVLLAEYFHVSTDCLLGITDDPAWRGGPLE